MGESDKIAPASLQTIPLQFLKKKIYFLDVSPNGKNSMAEWHVPFCICMLYAKI